MHLRELAPKFLNTAMEIECPKCRSHRLQIPLMGRGAYGIFPFPKHVASTDKTLAAKAQAMAYTLDRECVPNLQCGVKFEMRDGQVKLL